MLITGEILTELQKWPNNYFDMGVTSPPYNKVGQKGKLVKKVKYDNFDDTLDEQVYQDKQIEVLNELYRITKEGGSFFYNNKIRWVNGLMIHPYSWISNTNWSIRQEIVWNRNIAANIRGWRFWNIDERIYWLYKPKENNMVGDELQSRHAKLSSIWNIRPEQGIDHPAPFPIEIPTRCIYSILDGEPNKKIIDPYCGSGTTGVICKYFDYEFVGIDLSQNYIDFANSRIENAHNEYGRVEKELSLHNVSKKYKENNSINLFFDN